MCCKNNCNMTFSPHQAALVNRCVYAHTLLWPHVLRHSLGETCRKNLQGAWMLTGRNLLSLLMARPMNAGHPHGNKIQRIHSHQENICFLIILNKKRISLSHWENQWSLDWQVHHLDLITVIALSRVHEIISNCHNSVIKNTHYDWKMGKPHCKYDANITINYLIVLMMHRFCNPQILWNISHFIYLKAAF